MHKFLYWLISFSFLFHCHILGLKFFYADGFTVLFSKHHFLFTIHQAITHQKTWIFVAVEIHYIYQIFAVVTMYMFVQVYLNFHSITPLPMVVQIRRQSNVTLTSVQGTVTSTVFGPTLLQVRHLCSDTYTYVLMLLQCVLHVFCM